MPTPSSDSSPRSDLPQPRRYLVFFIVAMALFMSSVDQTIVSTALSTIQHELHAGIEWGGWIITIYALGQVLVMPLAGKVADIYGRKRVFLIAAVLFTGASLACGLSTNIYVLVVLRAIQAIGGGAFMPSATGIVSAQFGRDRDRAIGMFSSIFPIGGVVGPILGGVFVHYWSWRGIFLVNVPIGVLLIVLGLRFIPRSETKPTTGIDVRGVVLMGVLILSTMFAITYLGADSSSVLDPQFWIPLLLAIVSGVAFIRHTERAPHPFIPVRLLRGYGFGTMNLINFLFGAAALGFGALVPLYAQERYDVPVLAAGTLLTARAIGMICVAGIAVLSLRRIGYRPPMIAGFLIVATGLTVMSIAPHGVSAYVWLSIAAGITGIGMGMATPAANNAILQLAPDQISAIAGLRGMFRQAGAIMGVSVTTAIVARSADPGMALGHVFLAFAIIVICVVPLIFRIPEHRGTW